MKHVEVTLINAKSKVDWGESCPMAFVDAITLSIKHKCIVRLTTSGWIREIDWRKIQSAIPEERVPTTQESGQRPEENPASDWRLIEGRWYHIRCEALEDTFFVCPVCLKPAPAPNKEAAPCQA